jgi:hypothetical protein
VGFTVKKRKERYLLDKKNFLNSPRCKPLLIFLFLLLFSSNVLCFEVVCGEHLKRSAGVHLLSFSEEEIKLSVNGNEFLGKVYFRAPAVIVKFSFPWGLKFLLSPKISVGKFLNVVLSPEYSYCSSDTSFYRVGADASYLIFPDTIVTPHIKAGLGWEYLIRAKLKRENVEGDFYFDRWQAQVYCEVGKNIMSWMETRCGIKGTYSMSCLEKLRNDAEKVEGRYFYPSLFLGIAARYGSILFICEASFVKETGLILGVQKEF